MPSDTDLQAKVVAELAAAIYSAVHRHAVRGLCFMTAHYKYQLSAVGCLAGSVAHNCLEGAQVTSGEYKP